MVSQSFSQQITSLQAFVASGGPQRMRGYDHESATRIAVIDSLQQRGRAYASTVVIDTGICKSAVARMLNELLAQRVVSRTNTYPYVWELVNG